MHQIAVKSIEPNLEHATLQFVNKTKRVFSNTNLSVKREWYNDGVACYTVRWDGELPTQIEVVDGGDLKDTEAIRHMYLPYFPDVNIVRVNRDPKLKKSLYSIQYYLKNEKMDQINPQHYKQGKVECIDAIESATIGKKGFEAACTANVIKYLWRYESKAGIVDVEKAKWYLERLLKFLKEKQND